STEQIAGTAADAWEAVIATLGAQEAYEAAQAQVQSQQGQHQQQAVALSGSSAVLSPAEFLIFSPQYPNSLVSTIGRARSLARESREYLSREVFEEINRLYLSTARASTQQQALPALYANVKRSVAAILGMFDNTVVLTEGREWFRVGLFLERADMTARIIDTKYFVLLPSLHDVGGPIDRYQWMAVLRSASALEAFRKEHRGPVTGRRVVSMLMFDRNFPRSLAFSVAALRRHFERATAETPDRRVVRAAREAALIELDLRSANADNVVSSGLHEFLDEYEARLNAIDLALQEDIFRARPAGTDGEPI
ncbi:MAG: alpha-E domain-containing protein, partial [Dehalococcoidia bacterium]|nr:alpha-E domain-containing protein [Dehalococcoidia bacterium]